MKKPELIIIAGCNAAGKSTFIRSRLAKLEDFEILMADVYKGRTKELVKKAISQKKDILIETVFNDESYKDLVDKARDSGYQTSLIVLFLDSIPQSVSRVAFRAIQQSGIVISGGNIRINFNESFKNIANYFFYFERSDFVYTGEDGVNKLIMSFQKNELLIYHANDLVYPQKFADYSFQRGRLNEHGYKVIKTNESFENDTMTSSNQII
ncbi:MAG TPA: hypothetical protein VNX40_01975 [Mucilaginibacter sp.]|jgi:predicted ABC-type ATPase|nr:hypothetical protein [Mucilaginibacter sp.]